MTPNDTATQIAWEHKESLRRQYVSYRDILARRSLRYSRVKLGVWLGLAGLAVVWAVVG